MNIDWKKITTLAEGAAGLVVEYAPLMGLAGPQGALIGGIVTKSAEFVKSAATAAADASATIAAHDLVKLKAADDAVTAALVTDAQDIENLT